MRGRAGVGKGDNQALRWGNRKLSQGGFITGGGTLPLRSLVSFNASTSAPRHPGLGPFPVPLALFSLTGCLGVRVEAWGYYGPRVELHRC